MMLFYFKYFTAKNSYRGRFGTKNKFMFDLKMKKNCKNPSKRFGTDW